MLRSERAARLSDTGLVARGVLEETAGVLFRSQIRRRASDKLNQWLYDMR